jgi:hypothetical protein
MMILDDGLNNGFVGHHWYGSDIGGWGIGAVAALWK